MTHIVIVRDVPHQQELVSFRRITEVAVKAMSPGINDPGTALTALDYLGSLLAYRLKVPEYNCYTSDTGGKVYFAQVSFGGLLRSAMQSLRLYTKHDTILVLKQLSMLEYLLLQNDASPEQHQSILCELRALVEDVETSITNSSDRANINQSIAAINDQLDEKDRLFSLRQAPVPVPTTGN